MNSLRDAAQAALEALENAEDQLAKPYSTDASKAIDALRASLAQPNPAQQIVDEQAEDEGLWFRAQTAAEAYLQQELRRLHAAVEGEK